MTPTAWRTLIARARRTAAPETCRTSTEAPTVIADHERDVRGPVALSRPRRGTDARPAHYYDIAAEALEAGDAYVSALGGGTCNSEFEFLTGSTMGHLGGGVYPYVLYDLDGAESLVSYFDVARATPPMPSTRPRARTGAATACTTSWASTSSPTSAAFADADTLRGLTTDRATYDYVLDLLEADERPQFVFDVTLQNHGGYDVGGLVRRAGGERAASATAARRRSSTSTPASSARPTATSPTSWIRLNALDRPVVLCFFGDHQPGFSDWLFEADPRRELQPTTWGSRPCRSATPCRTSSGRTTPPARRARTRLRRRRARAHEPQLPGVEAGARPRACPRRATSASCWPCARPSPPSTSTASSTADGAWHGFGDEDGGRPARSTPCAPTPPSSTTTCSTRIPPGQQGRRPPPLASFVGQSLTHAPPPPSLLSMAFRIAPVL